MSDNPHFVRPASWEEAAGLLSFEPVRLRDTAGYRLESLAVHVRDHKRRELPVGGRSLEAHYDGFVFSQAHRGSRARRLALSVSYGTAAMPATVRGREGRAYALGPEVPADDVDGRSPAVVVWHDDGMFYLIASTELDVEVLLDVAASLYEVQTDRRDAARGAAGTPPSGEKQR